MNPVYDFDNFKISKVKLQILDWDKEYSRDMESGIGFDILDETGFDETKETLKENGIYSPKYGSSFNDDNSFTERFSCDCGKLQGTIFESEHCKECDTNVKFVDDNVFITGWFTLDDGYIIHPIMYNLLETVIGPKNFKLILEDLKKINREGKREHETINNDPKIFNAHPYVGCTIFGFKEKFDEIMEYFYNLKLKKIKNKDEQKYKFLKNELEDTYALIKRNRKKVFQNHIPIYSVLLRPIHLGETFSYSTINKNYTELSVLVYRFNERKLNLDLKSIKINRLLFRIQSLVNDIYKEIINTISAKEGQ